VRGRFRRFLTVFAGVDAQKARRSAIFRLWRVRVNGRKRSENGSKTVSSLREPHAIERDRRVRAALDCRASGENASAR